MLRGTIKRASLLSDAVRHVMMKGMANPLTKLRWQFSIRTMLLVVSVSCVTLSVWVVPAERQRRAVAAIRALGGTVSFVDNQGTNESFPAASLRRWLPPNYSDEVEKVNLDYVRVTDDEMAHLQGLTRLRVLRLKSARVTDAGLAYLQGLTDLRELRLGNTHVTSAGLFHLRGLTGLQELRLSGTQVTDEGLVYIQRLRDLQLLWLGSTQVTDAGVAHLKDLTSLEMIDLCNTRVTDAGLVQLRGALPHCIVVGP